MAAVEEAPGTADAEIDRLQGLLDAMRDRFTRQSEQPADSQNQDAERQMHEHESAPIAQDTAPASDFQAESASSYGLAYLSRVFSSPPPADKRANSPGGVSDELSRAVTPSDLVATELLTVPRGREVGGILAGAPGDGDRSAGCSPARDWDKNMNSACGDDGRDSPVPWWAAAADLIAPSSVQQPGTGARVPARQCDEAIQAEVTRQDLARLASEQDAARREEHTKLEKRFLTMLEHIVQDQAALKHKIARESQIFAEFRGQLEKLFSEVAEGQLIVRNHIVPLCEQLEGHASRMVILARRRLPAAGCQEQFGPQDDPSFEAGLQATEHVFEDLLIFRDAQRIEAARLHGEQLKFSESLEASLRKDGDQGATVQAVVDDIKATLREQEIHVDQSWRAELASLAESHRAALTETECFARRELAILSERIGEKVPCAEHRLSLEELDWALRLEITKLADEHALKYQSTALSAVTAVREGQEELRRNIRDEASRAESMLRELVNDLCSKERQTRERKVAALQEQLKQHHAAVHDCLASLSLSLSLAEQDKQRLCTLPSTTLGPFGTPGNLPPFSPHRQPSSCSSSAREHHPLESASSRFPSIGSLHASRPSPSPSTDLGFERARDQDLDHATAAQTPHSLASRSAAAAGAPAGSTGALWARTLGERIGGF